MINQECNIITSKGVHHWRVARARNFPCVAPCMIIRPLFRASLGWWVHPGVQHHALEFFFRRPNINIYCNPKLIFFGTALFVEPLIFRKCNNHTLKHNNARLIRTLAHTTRAPQTHNTAHCCYHCPSFSSPEAAQRKQPKSSLFSSIIPFLCRYLISNFSCDSLVPSIHSITQRSAIIIPYIALGYKPFLIRPVALSLAWPHCQAPIRPVLDSAPPDGTFTGTFSIYKDISRSLTDGPQATCL